MERFIYYQIEGFLPASFVDHELGMVKRYANREKAIEVLEKVLGEWKENDSFKSKEEFVNDCIFDDKLTMNYRHQFVFKNKHTGMFYEITYKVVKHHIVYEK